MGKVVEEPKAKVPKAQETGHAFWLYKDGKSFWGYPLHRPDQGPCVAVPEADHRLAGEARQELVEKHFRPEAYKARLDARERAKAEAEVRAKAEAEERARLDAQAAEQLVYQQQEVGQQTVQADGQQQLALGSKKPADEQDSRVDGGREPEPVEEG